MAQISPQDVFPSYSSDGTNITLPLALFPGLDAAEADATTGNGAELLRNLLEVAYTNIQALDSANQPTQMRWQKPPVAGVGTNISRQDYTFGFNIQADPAAVQMVAES